MKNEIVLKPSYWASVSGGKDSLYMLYLILKHRDKYPLDGVVHFELEIDYPFIKDVTALMKKVCDEVGVKFVLIKPEKTWEEMYYEKPTKGNIRGFPNRTVRWCTKYKLTAKSKLEKFMKSQGKYVVAYIGYCSDEQKRFANRNNEKEIYPLVDFGIEEKTILDWAKNQPIFNNYYVTNNRCGCMYCPMSSKMNFAYLFKYYPENFAYMIDKMRETEKIREKELGRPFSCTSSNPKYNADYLEHIIKTKWLHKLEEKENDCDNED